MTREELLSRASDRLNNPGSAVMSPTELPQAEALAAIVQLGNDLASVEKENRGLKAEIEVLKEKNNSLDLELRTAAIKAERAEEDAKEKEWISRELGNFVKGIANGLFLGQEVAAANRVYDLNRNSLTKHRLNAYDYESLQEAKMAFVNANNGEYDEPKFLEWLFSFVEKA